MSQCKECNFRDQVINTSATESGHQKMMITALRASVLEACSGDKEKAILISTTHFERLGI